MRLNPNQRTHANPSDADGHSVIRRSRGTPAARRPQPARHAPAPASRPGGAGRNGWPAAWGSMLLIAALVLCLNLLAWWAGNPSLPGPQAASPVAGLAYNGFQRGESPLARRYPDARTLDTDLQLLARLTPRLRTYSASEMPALPGLAQQHGLKLALGVWLDDRPDASEREMLAAIAAATDYRSVEQVIAGNETQLHGTLSPTQLHAHLDRLRAALTVPVSTAEPWHIWLSQPELVRHVDFITVHLLPYWEGVPVEQAVEVALTRLQWVRERHPTQRIVIGEIGWPSGGDRIGNARASPIDQARFVRSFLARAAQSDLDYYLMEAIDQPWKRATEGRVGAHWGMFDAARERKFELDGPIQHDPDWRLNAGLSCALGLAAMLPWLRAQRRMRLAARLSCALALQAVVSFAVLAVATPLRAYPDAGDLLTLLLLAVPIGLAAAILLAQVFEFAELFWPGSLRGQARPVRLRDGAATPFISIHLACCNEPPAMVIATIDSLLALDWPALEIIVVDNNTRDPALWQPVQAHVARRLREQRAARAGADAQVAGGACDTGCNGPRLRFFRLPVWPGYKAGALNFALARTDPRAQWVGVVDADYLVRPDWLSALAGYFDDPAIGALQSPQAHRDWAGSPLGRMMNWEYDGFFRIGMHHRHERNAIVQHGTMTLVRSTALRGAGNWSDDCICEDTELGLRLLTHGWRLVYIDEVLGTGLVPGDFSAYQRQRQRWAQGAMQILRKHAGALVGRSALTLGQRYHFLAGWLPWLGDAMLLGFSLAALLWTAGMLAAPGIFGPPVALFALPLAAIFTMRLLLVPLLYLRRVPCSAGDIAGASLAGLALSHCIARGAIAGLIGRPAVFQVTRKATRATQSNSHPVTIGAASVHAPQPAHRGADHFWSRLRGALVTVREEAALLAGLWLCVGALGLRAESAWAIYGGWMMVLALQTLPYAGALVCAMLAPPVRPIPTQRLTTGLDTKPDCKA